MLKNFLSIIYEIILRFDFLLKKIFKKSLVFNFIKFIMKNSYKEIKIKSNPVKFFCPNSLTEWRINTFFTKEPETLDWIDKFDDSKKITFWDIGANIGIYSIYAALSHKNIQIISFEPSTSNLRILSQNVSKNNLSHKINICQIALTNQKNKFLNLNESSFEEGSALHSYGETFNHEGNQIRFTNKYSLYGTNIDFLIENKILETPDYIKIDVDGIEHLILDGGRNCLSSDKIKSISLELNENFIDQYEKSLSILSKANFKLKEKKKSSLIRVSKEFKNTYNFIFEKTK